MTMTRVVRDDSTAAFFDGTAQGEFLLRRCLAFGHLSAPSAQQCGVCGQTELDSVPAGGGATLVSWAVVHGRPSPDLPAPPTEVVAIAELDEGPWWWSTLLDAEPSQLHIGDRVRIVFVTPADSEAIPAYRLER
jgi:uncharacterized protein